MLSPKHPKQLLILLAILALAGFGLVEMIYSTAPPRHADHDHAITSVNAGGFLRVDKFGGGKRNFAGEPGKVLIVHFCDPFSSNSMEQAQAARFSQRAAGDPDIEVVFLARAGSWKGIEDWAGKVGVPTGQIYLDKNGKTAEKFGVKRWPETLIYDADGTLAHQASGSTNWDSPAFFSQVARAKAGVEQSH